MKIFIISGKPGSGKTGELFKNFKENDDNFVVTTDTSVDYIEKAMTRQHVPGKCVGISSLARTINQEIGGISEKVISEEIQAVILSDIMLKSKLKSFKICSYNNSVVNDISKFINQCLMNNIKPEDLIFDLTQVSYASKDKLEDISIIYREFNKRMAEEKMLNQVMFIQKVTELLKIRKFNFKNIYIDSLNSYPPLMFNLIKALMLSAEEFYIAFTTYNQNAYGYDVFKESQDKLIEFREYASEFKSADIRYVEVKREEVSSGISIIQNEFFNRDTKTKATTDDVVLHEASTLYKEVDFVVSQIEKLIKNGISCEDIIITSTDMSAYKNILANRLSKNNISYYYYKNKRFSQTVFFNFIKTMFYSAKNGLDVDSILKLVNINYFNISSETLNLLNSYFNRFGNNLPTAMANGKIYDIDNFTKVKVIVDSLISEVEEFKALIENNDNFEGYSSALFRYIKDLNIEGYFVEQYESLKNEEPQIANEIVETWNAFVKIIENLNSLNLNIKISYDSFVDTFTKLCEDSKMINSKTYCDEIKILDLKDAENRKSKICFVIGCNEGKFPFNIPEGIITTNEINVINLKTKSVIPTVEDIMTRNCLSIYSALTMPTKKLYISWALNDTEARPMRAASMLNNVLKSFEDNLIPESTFYSEDKEELFYDLLTNLSEYRRTGICSEDVDTEYWNISKNPEFAERLSKVIKNSVVDKQKFNADDLVSSYKEKDFWSVTRLEKFNQCPFKHYVEFALLPQTQKLFEETAADKGSFYHDILNKIFKHLINNKIDFNSITEEEFKPIALKIIENCLSTHNENILSSKDSLKIEKTKMIRKIYKSSWNAVSQFREGLFQPFKTEFKIGKDIPLKIILPNGKSVNIIGVIDRIDEADINGDKYVRVIDYKSGSTTFSTEKVKLGLQLQLPLYMKSIIGEYKAAGLYYSRIVDPIRDADNSSDKISKKYQLNGYTLADYDVLSANDMLLGDCGSSDIIQADITTKGEISKKSKVFTQDEFNDFLNNAVETASETIKKILDGETKADPKKLTDYNACEYCQYKSICHK